MKTLLLATALLVTGCEAYNKAALKDCAVKVVPVSVLNTVSECGFNDKECLEAVARRNAIAAALAIDSCLTEKVDAAGQ